MLAFHSKEPFLGLYVAVLSLQVAVLNINCHALGRTTTTMSEMVSEGVADSL